MKRNQHYFIKKNNCTCVKCGLNIYFIDEKKYCDKVDEEIENGFLEKNGWRVFKSREILQDFRGKSHGRIFYKSESYEV